MKQYIKEYLKELLVNWNKHSELDGFVALEFKNDLENLLEYWDMRVTMKEEIVLDKYNQDLFTLDELKQIANDVEILGGMQSNILPLRDERRKKISVKIRRILNKSK